MPTGQQYASFARRRAELKENTELLHETDEADFREPNPH